MHLSTFASKLRKDIRVGAQDAFPSTGAHTGETPVALLKDMGVPHRRWGGLAELFWPYEAGAYDGIIGVK